MFGLERHPAAIESSMLQEHSNKVKETLVIDIDDKLMAGLSWANSFDFVN